MVKLSDRFKRMLDVYRIFAEDSVHDHLLDFSRVAAMEMFAMETHGVCPHGRLSKRHGTYNGFEVGKHWMDVTLAMWREDIASGLLFPFELYQDKKYQGVRWWLDRVIPNLIPSPQGR